MTPRVSPQDNTVAKPSGFAKREVEMRIEVNKAEEAKERKVEAGAAKGRTDDAEEGRVGRRREL